MKQSTNIFNNAATLLLKMCDLTLETIKDIQLKSQAYSKLMGCLDAIWAYGLLDSGLLTSDY
jgi:hypothetical protein